VTVLAAVVVLLRVPTGNRPVPVCRLQRTGWFAVKFTDWPTSMAGLVVGAVICNPPELPVVVVVVVVFPPPQLAVSTQTIERMPMPGLKRFNS